MSRVVGRGTGGDPPAGGEQRTEQSCLHVARNGHGYTSCSRAMCDGTPNVYRVVTTGTDGTAHYGDWLAIEP